MTLSELTEKALNNGENERMQTGNAPKMNLSDQIEEALRRQQQQGRTQTEMSELNGISQSHIQRILANPGKKIRGLKVETVMKMFPHATLNFNGNEDKPPASAEHIRARIIASIIPLDIPPESLQAVLRAINELNLE